MTDIHKLMYGNEAERKLWREAGAPLHDRDIEPRFYRGSVVVRMGYEGTYQVTQRRIDLEGNVTYNLRPVLAIQTTARDKMFVDHIRQQQDAAARGHPHDQRSIMLAHEAIRKAPGLSDDAIVDITMIDGVHISSIPEAELEPFHQSQLSLGKVVIKAGIPKRDKLRLTEIAAVTPSELFE